MAALAVSVVDVGVEIYFLCCGPKGAARALSFLQGE